MSQRNYYRVVPSSYIFFRDGDKVLLSRRKNTRYHDGEYSLPAGHIEEGEYAQAAAIREAQEETGVTISPENLRFVHTMYRMREDHTRVEYFFEVTKWEGEITNPEPDKCADLTWYSISDLPTDIIPYIKQALEQYIAGNPYSEFEEIG